MKAAILIAVLLLLLALFGGSFVVMCLICLHARWMTGNLDRAIQHSSLRRYKDELTAGFQWIAAQPSDFQISDTTTIGRKYRLMPI